MRRGSRSEEHTSELQSRSDLVCRLLLEKKNHRPWAWARSRGAAGGSRSCAEGGVERTTAGKNDHDAAVQHRQASAGNDLNESGHELSGTVNDSSSQPPLQAIVAAPAFVGRLHF